MPDDSSPFPCRTGRSADFRTPRAWRVTLGAPPSSRITSPNAPSDHRTPLTLPGEQDCEIAWRRSAFRVRYPGHVGSRGALIGDMGSAVGSDAGAGGVAGPGAGGIVSRPRLFERLGTSARVTVVSAPPGSGKTVLLRSWISQAGAAASAAWVTVRRGERDPVQFWLSVLGSLRQTASGLALIRPLTAAPDLDGWAIAERLLTDLAPLQDRTYLVIDDVQELDPGEAQRQLELLVMRAPEELRFVLATRHDVRLGLHRMRLAGELGEIREPDLRFTVAEAAELFDAAGVKLPDPARLVERTEGWAAGLRMAALSLAGHPDPR